MTAEALRDSIRAARDVVAGTFGGLSEEQAETQVHMEEGGWTAKQVLAHLTSNRARLDMYLDPQATVESLYGPGYWAWNQRWVDDRDSWDRGALLAAFREQIDSSLVALDALPPGELERLVVSSGENPPRRLHEWFEIVCARHCVRHTGVVASVLGLPGPVN